MNTKIWLALCLIVLGLAGRQAARAGEGPKENRKGKILVLDNERLLEGDIEQLGDQFRVRRNLGELWLERENVLHLCNTREEAFRFLQKRANLDDPDEHLRLAKWCQVQGLRKQAAEEARKALSLKPHDPQIRRLLRMLEKPITGQSAKNGKAHPEPTTLLRTPPAVNNDSLSVYVARIQPLLMNTCAGCHASGQGGGFKLARTYEGTGGGRRSTLHNLAAILDRLNLDQPEASPLLSKAISVHAETMANPPLKSKDSPAYKALEEWVKKTIESNPHLRERATASAEQSGRNNATSPFADLAGTPNSPPPAKQAQPTVIPPTTTPLAETTPSKTPVVQPSEKETEPTDPFDPGIFNRQLHPETTQKKSSEK